MSGPVHAEALARKEAERLKNKIRAGRALQMHHEAIIVAAVAVVEGDADLRVLAESVDLYRKAVEKLERM